MWQIYFEKDMEICVKPIRYEIKNFIEQQ